MPVSELDMGWYSALTGMAPNGATRYEQAHVTPVVEDLAAEARGNPGLPASRSV